MKSKVVKCRRIQGRYMQTGITYPCLNMAEARKELKKRNHQLALDYANGQGKSLRELEKSSLTEWPERWEIKLD